MTESPIVGLDLAKRVFQVHGATADGGVALRKKLSRDEAGKLSPRAVEGSGSDHSQRTTQLRDSVRSPAV
jgi:hypothetical protein